MADAGPRTAIAVLVFEVAACTVTPSGMHPCILELETSDDRVLATLRGLTGCVVRTRQILRQPDPGVF